MTDPAFHRFRKEIDSFYLVIILNIVFGALAMAFGIAYIVSSIAGLADWKALPLLPTAIGAVALAAFGLGLSWLISSVEILDGVDDIRSEYSGFTQPVPEEVLVSGIIRMIAHYREHQTTIRRMILVCTIGGFCFLALGVLGSIEFFSVDLTSGTMTLDGYRLIPSIILTLGIAAVSLVSSYYFGKFSRTWDLRQDQAVRSEQVLAERLGRD